MTVAEPRSRMPNAQRHGFGVPNPVAPKPRPPVRPCTKSSQEIEILATSCMFCPEHLIIDLSSEDSMLLLTMPSERSIRPKWKAGRRPQASTGREYGSRSRCLNMEILEGRQLLA